MFLRIPFIRKSICTLFRSVHAVFYFKQKTFLYCFCLNIDKTAFTSLHPSTRFQRIIQYISKQYAQVKFVDAVFLWHLHITLPFDVFFFRPFPLLVQKCIHCLIPCHIPVSIQSNTLHIFQITVYLLPFFIPGQCRQGNNMVLHIMPQSLRLPVLL